MVLSDFICTQDTISTATAIQLIPHRVARKHFHLYTELFVFQLDEIILCNLLNLITFYVLQA